MAIIGAAVASAAITLPLYGLLAVRQSVIGSADAAALAAADTATGMVPGVPCEVAARVAHANGAVLDGCTVDGYVVTVHVIRTVLGVRIGGDATAGPPDDD